jgi:hypothetical protein
VLRRELGQELIKELRRMLRKKETEARNSQAE